MCLQTKYEIKKNFDIICKRVLAKLFYTTHRILETFSAILRSFVVGISKVLLREMPLDEIAFGLKTKFITNRGFFEDFMEEKITIKIESEL